LGRPEGIHPLRCIESPNNGTDPEVLYLGGGSFDDTLAFRWTTSGGSITYNLTNPSGRDEIYGGDGWDTLIGDRGNDTIEGGIGNDTLEGERGNDTLRGEDDDDVLIGGDDDDTLEGGDDDDVLCGGRNEDDLFGEGGDDVLWPGHGTSKMGDPDVAGSTVDGGAHSAGDSCAPLGSCEFDLDYTMAGDQPPQCP